MDAASSTPRGSCGSRSCAPGARATWSIAHVLEVDGFGNLRLDAEPGEYSSVAGRAVTQGRTFGDVPPGDLVLYADSDGGLALAVNGGSAAALVGVRTGDEVRLS